MSKKSKKNQSSKVKDRKTKYDWIMIKNEYIHGDFDEIKAFFLNKFGFYNSFMQHNSNGWIHERRSYRQQIADEVNKRIFNEEVKSKAAVLRKILNVLIDDIKSPEFKKLSPKAKKIYWDIWRIENNLPTHLSKFQQLANTEEDTLLDDHVNQLLKSNGIDPSDTM